MVTLAKTDFSGTFWHQKQTKVTPVASYNTSKITELGINDMKTSIDVMKILSQLITNGSIKPSAIDHIVDRLDLGKKSMAAKDGE